VVQVQGYAPTAAQIDEVEAKLKTWHKTDECSQRSSRSPASARSGGSADDEDPAPGCPIGATGSRPGWADAEDHSTPQGQARRHHPRRRKPFAPSWCRGPRRDPASRGTETRVSWLVRPSQRKPPKLAAVALANKLGRVALRADGHSEALHPETATAFRRARPRDQPDTGSNSTADRC